jgi:hypothetical protein
MPTRWGAPRTARSWNADVAVSESWAREMAAYQPAPWGAVVRAVRLTPEHIGLHGAPDRPRGPGTPGACGGRAPRGARTSDGCVSDTLEGARARVSQCGCGRDHQRDQMIDAKETARVFKLAACNDNARRIARRPVREGGCELQILEQRWAAVVRFRAALESGPRSRGPRETGRIRSARGRASARAYAARCCALCCP